MIKAEIVLSSGQTYRSVLEDSDKIAAWEQEGLAAKWWVEGQYTLIQTDVTQELINNQALNYLQSTDWYVIRFADSGEPVPEDVKIQRAAARAQIVRS